MFVLRAAAGVMAGLGAQRAARYDRSFARRYGMGLMMLAAGPGITITIKAIGKDAAKAVETLCTLVASGFGEED